MTPRYAKDIVETLGGIIYHTSEKNLSYIITNRPKSKYSKFQENGIKILTEQEFIYLIEGRSKIT